MSRYQTIRVNVLQLNTIYIIINSFPALIILSHPKILYFPLPKSNFLKSLSGMWHVPPKHISSTDFDSNIETILIKYCFNLYYSTSPIKDISDVVFRLGGFLKPSKHIDVPYYYPAVQHIVNSIHSHYAFPINKLEEMTQYKVDYSFFLKYVPAQPVLEAHVIKHFLIQIFQKHGSSVRAFTQNPDNPLGTHKQYAEQSYALIKQPNPDLVIEILQNLPQEVLKRLFKDVKLKEDPLHFLSLMKGFLTLTPQLNDGQKQFFIKKDAKDNISQHSQYNETSFSNDLQLIPYEIPA